MKNLTSHEPTIKEPYDVAIFEHYVPVTVSEFFVFDVRTGRALLRFHPMILRMSDSRLRLAAESTHWNCRSAVRAWCGSKWMAAVKKRLTTTRRSGHGRKSVSS
jgi:hypothetical protein